MDISKSSLAPVVQVTQDDEEEIDFDSEDEAKKWIKLLPNSQYRLWSIGNHDIRLDNYIAANASELDNYIMSLQEHFPDWQIRLSARCILCQSASLLY
jgi:hypothetical protein